MAMSRTNKVRPCQEKNVARRSFPIHQEVRYKCFRKIGVEESGSGRTLDISSGAITFTTQRILKPGQQVEVMVNWPALLDEKCLMKLVVLGRVIRSELTSTTINIAHYEFRTRANHTAI
jgi:hypothetical protein